MYKNAGRYRLRVIINGHDDETWINAADMTDARGQARAAYRPRRAWSTGEYCRARDRAHANPDETIVHIYGPDGSYDRMCLYPAL